MMLLNKIQRTDAPTVTVLIRVLVGAVFLSEGIQKFLFPGDLRAGRFLRIFLRRISWDRLSKSWK